MVNEWMFAIHDKANSSNAVGKNVAGWLHVLTAGVATSPTVYTNKGGTSTLTATNTIAVVPIVNGYARFWLDESITTIDVCYFTATGESGMAKGVTRGVPSYLAVDTHFPGYQTLWVPVAFLAATAFVDTTIDLPADLEIVDAGLRVTTLDSAVTLDLGFKNAVESGDEDGLLDGMLCTNAGLVSPWPIITAGSTHSHYLDTNGKFGALLSTIIVGADTSDVTMGGYTRKSYLTDGTITSLGYTPANSDTLEGFAYVTYRKCMG